MSSNKTPEPGGIEFPIQTKPTMIIVAGLDRDTTERGVARALEIYGPLLAIELSRDSKGRSRGVGTATFASHGDAITAIESADTLRIDNRSPRLRLRETSDPPSQESHDGWTEIRKRKSTPKVERTQPDAELRAIDKKGNTRT